MSLGFKKKKKVQFIFVGKEQNCLWYFRQNNQNFPIEDDQIECVLMDVALGMSKSETNPELKLRISIIADDFYIIQVGIDTYFAKNFLYKILNLPLKAMTCPITIEVSSGKKSIVFCNLYSNGFAVNPIEDIPKYGDKWNIEGTVQKVKDKIVFSRELLQPDEDDLPPQHLLKEESSDNGKQLSPVPEDDEEDFIPLNDTEKDKTKDIFVDDIPF